MSGMYEESIRDEFTHQTDAFARSPVMTAAGRKQLVAERKRWQQMVAAIGRVLDQAAE